MNRVLAKEAAALLTELNGRKNALESMKMKISCGEGGLAERLRRAKVDVEVTEAAFSALSYKERDILEAFYIEREPRAVDRLCEKYSCAKSTIYRLKRQAMREFVLRVFGYAD